MAAPDSNSSMGDAQAITESTATNCLFENEWWLEAVHDGQVKVLEVRDKGSLMGRMVLPMTRRHGLISVRQPPLTQTLGPWLAKISENPEKQISFEIMVMKELIAQLPKVDFFSQNFHHARANWLPFFWSGFNAMPRITYMLEDIASIDRLWNQLRGSVRTDIRKARQRVGCEITEDVDEFLRVYHKTFERQQIQTPQTDAVVRQLDAACAARNCRRIFLARDELGQVHSVLYVVWDARTTYYLMAGSDPKLRSSGANSLLLWNAITFASGVSRSFDFEGSMGENIERFIRSFAAQQRTYLNVRRSSRPVRAALLLRDAMSILSGR